MAHMSCSCPGMVCSCCLRALVVLPPRLPPQTVCSARATDIEVVNVESGAVAFQRYKGTCNLTAVARCCKQTCPVLPPPPDHKLPEPHEYYDHHASNRQGHEQQHQHQHHHDHPKTAAAASVAVAAGGAAQPALFGQDAATVSRLGLLPTHRQDLPASQAGERRDAWAAHGAGPDGYHDSYDSYSQPYYDSYDSASSYYYDSYSSYDSYNSHYYGSADYHSYYAPTGGTGATGPQQEHHHHGHGPGFLKQVSKNLLFADHCGARLAGCADQGGGGALGCWCVWVHACMFASLLTCVCVCV